MKCAAAAKDEGQPAPRSERLNQTQPTGPVPHRSGTLTILAGSSSITQTGINIDSSSVVLATLQQNRSGLWVQAAVPSVSGSSFTIYLNHATNSNAAVGWFVVN